MATLKSQYENVKDPLTTVSTKIPESLQRAVKATAESLDITSSQLVKIAIEQYVDGIRNADLALELKLIADGVSIKSAEVFAQNSVLLANQEQILGMLQKVIDEDSDFEDRIMKDLGSTSGAQS